MDRQQSTIEHAKSKNRFTLCCFCLGGSGSDPDLSGATFDYSDRCDYVVEKLTIKKVPIALFATDEDLAEMRSAAIMEKCQEPVTTTTGMYEANLLPKDSILSSYYAMINNRSNEETPTTENVEKTMNHRMKLGKGNFSTVLSLPKKSTSVDVTIDRDSESTDSPDAFYDIKESKHEADLLEQFLQPLPMPAPALKPILKQNEIVKADIHSTKTESLSNRYNISPELEKTLTVLGTKRPDTSQSIKERMVVKSVRAMPRAPSPTVEVRVKHVQIVETNESIQAELSLPEAINCSVSAAPLRVISKEVSEVMKGESSMASAESRDFVDNQGILVEQDVQTRLTSRELDAMINGDVNGPYPNPKWKIIIKEHSKEMMSSTTTSKSTSTSESDSDEEEESEYEETTTE